PVTWEQHKSNGIIDTVNDAEGYASLSDIETYGTNITYNHNFQTSSSYKGGNHKYYNEVVNYDTTRLEYLKLLQVTYREKLALVAANDDRVENGVAIGGSNKNSNGSRLYWIVNEWDKDGNSLTMTKWYETNQSYTVGTGDVADNQKQITGYNTSMRYGVKYATLLFRWNNGDTNIGSGKDAIDKVDVADVFERFYVCYKPFTYTFRDGPDMIRTIERFGVSDPFENTDYMLPDEADLTARPGYYLKGWKVVSGDPNDDEDNKQYGMIFTIDQLEEMMTSGEFYSSLFADTVFEAVWAPEEYKITYDLQGGTVSPANPTTYNVETPTFTLNNPIKAGYKFTGWTGSNGATPEVTVTITKGSTGDKSYTANWERIDYAITYDLQGGIVSPANPSTYHVETPTFTLNNPTRVGYNFIGWTGSNGTTPQLTVAIVKGSTGDRHYVANWETAEVDVTVRHYVMDVKGNFPTNPTKTNTVKLIVGKSYADDYGADYFKDSGLEQEGIIIFSGYEFPSSGVVSATSSENVVKLYYSRKTYTVTFNVSENLGWWGASISDKEDRKYLFRHGEEINFADYVPKSQSLERDFIGWNVEVDGRRATTSYTVTSDVTFYAQFRTRKILGLTDASGRSQRTITLYNKEGSKRVVFPYLNTYRAWTEVSGSIGAGWTTANSIDAPNGLTAGYLEAHEYGIGVSLEVYGIYKGFANVVFDENGGKETDDTDDKIVNVYRNSGDLSKTKGEEVTLPNCTRDNTDNGDGSITVYTLGGWKCGEDFYPVGATVPITENTTFVAQWDTEIKYIEYTIVFDMNGGKFGPDPITVKYGQEVILPKKGSRVGFKLVDWCTTPDGTGVRYQPEVVVKNLTNVNRETVVLYAQWKQKDFLLVKISSSRYNATFIRRTEGDDAWFNSVGKITINEWATMTEEEKNAISKYRFHIDKDGNITQIS
ncbi:MAG: InlB B-repeat-containing protein, partial [Lachnospira sp.]|nr:InlB B-repeat-containing protein [Lachnospira sp.]